MTAARNPRALPFAHGDAICYSGYRDGQSPQTGVYPSSEEIREDLLMLAEDWRYLRLYDCGPHAERVLAVIRDDRLPLQVMLGADMAAEIDNPACPWGGCYGDAILAANRRANAVEVDRLISLANSFDDIVFAVSIGNEASVDWTDHMVPVERLIDHARTVRRKVSQPVTFCENYVPWTSKLMALADELDFISMHTYPAWEYRSIHEALDYTKENFRAVAEHYRDKTVVITEAGWTTAANGRGIDAHNASEAIQAEYVEQLLSWSRDEKILTFVFEAFDERWKGAEDPAEPEKHWGLFNVDRTPKLLMQRRSAGFAGTD